MVFYPRQYGPVPVEKNRYDHWLLVFHFFLSSSLGARQFHPQAMGLPARVLQFACTLISSIWLRPCFDSFFLWFRVPKVYVPLTMVWMSISASVKMAQGSLEVQSLVVTPRIQRPLYGLTILSGSRAPAGESSDSNVPADYSGYMDAVGFRLKQTSRVLSSICEPMTQTYPPLC
ncbi:hypothetical protein B0H12DRAFT_105053 [Mycena haematopus]|nr:hypothetical protein B0H12DRAFT_105053 [Mycena haematopus]